MFLFDTDIISNIFKKMPSPQLINKLNTLSKDKQYLSSITIYEIVYGAYKSNNFKKHIYNLQKVLLPSVNIVNYDLKSTFICGKLRAQLERKDTPVSLSDLQIASIAIANDFTLITGNIKHFQKIEGLKIENWL